MALGLGAVGKQGIEVAKRSKGVEFFREVSWAGRALTGAQAVSEWRKPGAGEVYESHGSAAAVPNSRKRGLAAVNAQVARCAPWVVQNYKLEELTTVPELRKNIAILFRKHADVSTPEVIDLLIYTGRGELEARGWVGWGLPGAPQGATAVCIAVGRRGPRTEGEGACWEGTLCEGGRGSGG